MAPGGQAIHLNHQERNAGFSFAPSAYPPMRPNSVQHDAGPHSELQIMMVEMGLVCGAVCK